MCDETHSWINEKDQALSTEDCGRDLSSVQALQRRHQVGRRYGRKGAWGEISDVGEVGSGWCMCMCVQALQRRHQVGGGGKGGEKFLMWER